jgi:hypothetical protein
MIREHLGPTIDIHGGGRDLIFPHHENELAQSCCAYGDEFVRYWMHNAFLDMDGEKMSKSLGNVRTIRELLGSYRGEVLRFALLSAHYRSPLNFSAELLEQAGMSLDGFYTRCARAGHRAGHGGGARRRGVLRGAQRRPQHAAGDQRAARPGPRAEQGRAARQAGLKARLLAAGNLLGILAEDPEDWLQGGLLLLLVDPAPQALGRPLASLAVADSRFVTVPFPGTDGITLHYLYRDASVPGLHRDASDPELHRDASIPGASAGAGPEADSGGTPTFLLLHGFTLNAFSWQAQVETLARHGRVIAPDQLPYGLSEKLVPGDWSAADPYARASAIELLHRLLDQLGVSRAIVIGHSSGSGYSAVW